jgi:hypothetical protein
MKIVCMSIIWTVEWLCCSSSCLRLTDKLPSMLERYEHICYGKILLQDWECCDSVSEPKQYKRAFWVLQLIKRTY